MSVNIEVYVCFRVDRGPMRFLKSGVKVPEMPAPGMRIGVRNVMILIRSIAMNVDFQEIECYTSVEYCQTEAQYQEAIRPYLQSGFTEYVPLLYPGMKQK